MIDDYTISLPRWMDAVGLVQGGLCTYPFKKKRHERHAMGFRQLSVHRFELQPIVTSLIERKFHARQDYLHVGRS